MTAAAKTDNITITDPRAPGALEVWEAYYANLANTTPLSLHPRWSVALAAGLGHRPYLLTATAGQEPGGYLLVFLVESLLFGRYLVSQPYLNYGGPVTSNPEVAQQLIQRADHLAQKLGVKYLELRTGRYEAPGMAMPSLHKVNARRRLAADSPTTWASLSPKVRNQVRKAQKHGLTCRWGGSDLLPDFYRIFARNMRDLGTPVYDRKLFAAILANFPKNAEIAVTYAPTAQGPTAVAAGLLTHGNGISEVLSASSLRAYNGLNGNMLLYWHMVERTIARGHETFDLGRCSEGSGCYQFKKNWQATFTAADWYFSSGTGDPSQLRRHNPKFNALTAAWQHLPVGIANRLGPHIVRGIP